MVLVARGESEGSRFAAAWVGVLACRGTRCPKFDMWESAQGVFECQKQEEAVTATACHRLVCSNAKRPADKQYDHTQSASTHAHPGAAKNHAITVPYPCDRHVPVWGCPVGHFFPCLCFHCYEHITKSSLLVFTAKRVQEKVVIILFVHNSKMR